MESACMYTTKTLGINQWQNTAKVIEWFSDVKKKEECTFSQCDIMTSNHSSRKIY